MIIKNEIEIHQKSMDYMNEVFSMYTEIKKLERQVRDPIFHLYPEKDTYNADGELNGYADAILFRVDVYDTSKKTVWKSNRCFDGLNAFQNLNVRTIRIFKDLSTMVVLDGDYIVNDLSALEISKVK